MKNVKKLLLLAILALSTSTARPSTCSVHWDVSKDCSKDCYVTTNGKKYEVNCNCKVGNKTEEVTAELQGGDPCDLDSPGEPEIVFNFDPNKPISNNGNNPNPSAYIHVD